MKPKQLFIVLVIILLAATLLFPKSKEQKYCDQFSGESDTRKPSNNFLTCQSDAQCQIDQDTLTTKEIDETTYRFMCIPVTKNSSPSDLQ